MDGLHDLGGKQGFGRVKYPSAPHNENWRPLVRALHAFAIESHIYNMDEFRHAIERMTPRHYISAPNFERHLTACPHCREYLDQMRVTIALLGRVEPESLAPEVRDELVTLYRRWRA